MTRLRFVVYHVYFFFIQRDTDPTCPVIFACVELMLDLLNRLGAENMLSSLQSCVSGVGHHGPYSLITMLLEVVCCMLLFYQFCVVVKGFIVSSNTNRHFVRRVGHCGVLPWMAYIVLWLTVLRSLLNNYR